MKKSIVLTLLPIFLLAGNAIAFDLSGDWTANNYCVPSDYADPAIPNTVPKHEESKMTIAQNGEFFVVTGISPNPAEVCGGIVDGDEIHMTCPGTIFHGEIIGNKKNYYIVGINHNPTDGATCIVEATKD